MPEKNNSYILEQRGVAQYVSLPDEAYGIYRLPSPYGDENITRRLGVFTAEGFVPPVHHRLGRGYLRGMDKKETNLADPKKWVDGSFQMRIQPPEDFIKNIDKETIKPIWDDDIKLSYDFLTECDTNTRDKIPVYIPDTREKHLTKYLQPAAKTCYVWAMGGDGDTFEQAQTKLSEIYDIREHLAQSCIRMILNENLSNY